MQSTVTLMHFVHPLWFDQLGHWEKAENIQYFVDFVKVAFKWVQFFDVMIKSGVGTSNARAWWET